MTKRILLEIMVFIIYVIVMIGICLFLILDLGKTMTNDITGSDIKWFYE